MLQIKLKIMEHRAPCKLIFYPYTHPQPLGLGQEVKTFFLKVVMLHIKLKEMEHRAPHKHIFCPFTHPLPMGYIFCPHTHTHPLGKGQKVKAFFLKVIMLNIKLKGMERRAPCKHIFCLSPWDGVKWSKYFF